MFAIRQEPGCGEVSCPGWIPEGGIQACEECATLTDDEARQLYQLDYADHAAAQAAAKQWREEYLWPDGWALDYDHLLTLGARGCSVAIWDTGQASSMGKSRLAYAATDGENEIEGDHLYLGITTPIDSPQVAIAAVNLLAYGEGDVTWLEDLAEDMEDF